MPLDQSKNDRRADRRQSIQQALEAFVLECDGAQRRPLEVVALQIAFGKEREIDALTIAPLQIRLEALSNAGNIVEPRPSLESGDAQRVHRLLQTAQRLPFETGGLAVEGAMARFS